MFNSSIEKHHLFWASIENLNFVYSWNSVSSNFARKKNWLQRSIRANVFWLPFQETLHSELHQNSKSTSVHQFFGSIKNLRASPSGLLHICTKETIPIQNRILHICSAMETIFVHCCILIGSCEFLFCQNFRIFLQ